MTRKINKLFINILFFGSAILLYSIMLALALDNDMFFEIVSGRDLLRGNFSTATHLDNFPIIVQQWGYAVTLALFDKLGTIGLYLWVVIQDFILWALSTTFIYKKTKNKKMAMIGSFLAIIICGNYMINIRPQIITAIFLVAELLLLEYYREKKQIKYLLFIFPLLIAAANFHQALFLYHIIAIFPYCLTVDLINKFEKKETINDYVDWKLVLFIPAYLLCSLCTPYGVDGFLYVFKALFSNTYQVIKIKELAPINLLSVVGIELLAVFIIVTVLLARKKIDMFTVIYTYGVFILSVMNTRHVSILIIPMIYLISNVDFSVIKNKKMYFSFLCMLLSVFYVYTGTNIYHDYGRVAEIIPNKDARIYNSAIDIGGWLEYNGYTCIYMDSRSEAFSEAISGDPDRINNYIATKYGLTLQEKQIPDEDILAIIENYDYVISIHSDYINRIIDGEKIYEDNTYIIWKCR